MNTTISFYNGIRARPEDFNPDTWETNNYKVCVILSDRVPNQLALLPQACEAGNLSRHASRGNEKDKNNFQIFDPANMPIGTIDIPEWAQVTRPSMSHFANLIIMI